jgi:internalin A
MKNRVVVGAIGIMVLLAAGIGFILLTKDDGPTGRGGRHLSHEEMTRPSTTAHDIPEQEAIEALGGSVRRTMPTLPISTVSFRDRSITDTDLAGVGHLGHVLEMDLSGTRVTDAVLPTLNASPQLMKLDLSRTGVTGAGLKDLGGLSELSLAGTRVTDEALAALRELPNLSVLNLSGTAVTPAGLARLKDLPQLRSLNLADTALTDAGIEALDPLSLDTLDISRTKVTSRSVPVLRGMKALQELAFDGVKVTPAEADELNELFAADTLRSSFFCKTDAALKSIRDTLGADGLKAMVESRLHVFDEDRGDDPDAGESLETVLDLSRSEITDVGLGHLRGFHGYTVLLAGRSGVAGPGLADLAGHPRLRIVTLGGTAVTDAGLGHLAGIPALYTVGLRQTAVTDAGLPALAKVRTLSRLDLNGTKVTDAGLPALAGLDRLRTLHLGGTAVSDAGLKHLEGLKGLRYLNLAATKVSEAGVKGLTAALPDCTISTSDEPFVLGLKRLPRPKDAPRFPAPAFGK